MVERLANDLRQAFPDMAGFSPRNLMYVRAFAEAWPDEAIVQQLVAQLPWGHNLKLLEMLSDAETRAWYARAAVEHGWSRNVLVHQIETRLHERQGAALSNFHRTLPAQQSELAQQLLKDPCQFDFLTLGATARERVSWSGPAGSVTPATDDELVQMFVCPAHDRLDDSVQLPDRRVLKNQHSSPARWTCTPRTDSQLEHRGCWLNVERHERIVDGSFASRA